MFTLKLLGFAEECKLEITKEIRNITKLRKGTHEKLFQNISIILKRNIRYNKPGYYSVYNLGVRGKLLLKWVVYLGNVLSLKLNTESFEYEYFFCCM